MFVSRHNRFDRTCTRDYAERYHVLSENNQSQYFSSWKSISIDGVALDHFNKLKQSTIPMAKSHFHLYDESDQNSSTTGTHLHIFLQFILTKLILAPFLTTMWDHTDGCTN